MLTVYFDMDGVLTDLDGWLAKKFRVETVSLVNREARGELLRRAVEYNPAFPAELPQNRVLEFSAIMAWLKLRQVNVEILTSYGNASLGDCGAQAHVGKVQWLTRHYLAEFQTGAISRFNGVQNCWQKQLYATPRSLLVDDQPENCEQFRAAGGRAILYDLTRHDEFVTEFEKTIREMS